MIVCLLAVRLVAKQNQYIRGFAQEGAVSTGAAKSLSEMQLVDSRIFRFLVRNGVIQAATADRWFLDQARAESFRVQRLRRTVFFVTGAILVVCAVWVWAAV